MMAGSNRELDAAGILAMCQDAVPVNANASAAIEAHRMAVSQRSPKKVLGLALTAVLLAATRTVEDDQAKLDYLSTVPESGWPPSPAPFCAAREDHLMAIRLSIGWRTQVSSECG